MKTIALTKGYVSTVDDEDFEKLSRFKWQALVYRRSNGTELVHARRSVGKPKKTLLMHAEICGYSKADHKDGDGLNNLRSNLRPASHSQNGANRSKRGGVSSIFLGVYWNSKTRRWQAQVRKNGKAHHIGCFSDEWDAATAYNFKALELHGEFANINTWKANPS